MAISESAPFLARACQIAHPVDDEQALTDVWALRFDEYVAAEEGTREALCALGNGYWGVRGAGEDSVSDGVHYPGTYFAGVYDVVEGDVDAGPMPDEEIVNAPNWLAVRFRPAGEEAWFDLDRLDRTQILDFRQELDIRHGILARQFTVRDDRGRVTTVRSDRFVSQASPRSAGLRVSIVPVDWSGSLAVRVGIDGRVANANAPEHSRHPHRHLRPTLLRQISADTLLLEVETRASRIRIATAARTTLRLGETEVSADRRFESDPLGAVWQDFSVTVSRGEPVVLEKTVHVSTSRDRAVLTPAGAASDAAVTASSFRTLLADHARAWERLWLEFAVELRPSGVEARALHFNTFHVLQTLNAVDTDLDAGIPARGLHGEGYDGHVFWDELFVYPFVTVRRPRLSAALLAYRHRRLGAGREAAARAGRRGACFPWQSGIAGNDVTPTRLFNPLSQRWMDDNSSLQRHVGLAVAFSAWQYYESTGDIQFLLNEGADLIIDVARFFVSLTTYDPARDRYSIAGVMGPDEYHDGPADRPGAGVRDNVYTNVMTAWVLRRAITAAELLREYPGALAWRRVGVGSAELDDWERISHRLTVVFNRDGTLSQFDGYDDLELLDLAPFRQRYAWIGRLDLILAARGDTTNRYQVSKQPDVLMLLYLLSAEELRELLATMGYDFPAETVTRTVDRYSATCTFGSTLANVVHAWLEARRDRARSYRFLSEALHSDLDDLQHGTVREGVHIGAMAGSVDIVTRCYLGLEMREGRLRFHPVLPDEIERIRFHLVYRDHALSVTVSQGELKVASTAGTAAPIAIVVEGAEAALATGETKVFALEARRE
ncbi:glycoside hydrolase family 65 protein [Microbacterium thalassium]|uniref:glycoside hydrolase family 65 protein n=1 Tax=Microbacterium TaxID=33882 RepID=UPI001469CF40|nr:glycoside hydrolase family 65 protein [Microbacterium thalassium]